MIAHSIAAAAGSGLFDRIVVSTDDDEIAAVSERFGAEVPFRRPAGLANDHAGLTEVVAHATEWLEGTGANVDAVCCILATAPFLRAADLVSGLAALESGDWQYAFAATTYAFPIFRSFERDSSGGVKMFFPEHFGTRSQDLPEALHDAGQFYWGRPGAWQSNERIFGARSTVVMIPRWRVQDIDTEEDWTRAELMSRALSGQAHSTSGRQ